MKTIKIIKNILFLCYIISTISCNNKNNFNKTNSSSNNMSKIFEEHKNTESDTFLELFSDIDYLDFHVYSPRWDSTGSLVDTQFEGQVIDVNKYSFFNNATIFMNIQSYKNGLSNIYAIGKFKISDKYIALIIRQYSQYEESLIQLLLWDVQDKKILRGIDLADSFGDAGWYFIKESWIYRKKNLKIITRTKEFEFTDNNKIRIFSDSLKSNCFENEKFVQTNLSLTDTINFGLKCITY